ncbi:MAG: hypothetical protein RLZZ543_1349 [Bacteroidota bacterium]|jgi:hypothetical protein
MGNLSFAAGLNKVDRDKVYGYVEEVVLDTQGKPCSTGSLLDDGQTLVLSGATALKTVDANNAEVDKKTLKTVYLDGKDATLIPSSYDGEIELAKGDLDDLFNLEVTTVYQLIWEDATSKTAMLNLLEGGNVFQFVFNYRADYEGADALVLSSQNEIFVLTGRMLEFDFLENKSATPLVEEFVEESEEEMDFGML